MISFTFFDDANDSTMGRETCYFRQEGSFFDLQVFLKWVEEHYSSGEGKFFCYVDFMREVSEGEYVLNTKNLNVEKQIINGH